jgi:hypothetical protein
MQQKPEIEKLMYAELLQDLEQQTNAQVQYAPGYVERKEIVPLLDNKSVVKKTKTELELVRQSAKES